MSFLDEKITEKIKKEFEQLTNPVRLVYFTQELECEYCKDTHSLLKEIANLSDKLRLDVYNFAVDKEMVTKYGINKIPAIVIEGEKDFGIRFYGVPSGYEFSSLLEAILDASRGTSTLPQAIKDELKKIDKPVHMQVFVTPTCPYCPRAVRFAHQAAMESEFITGDMVEASEFPQLVYKYGVQGVPKTVINEEFNFAGALPEQAALKVLMSAYNKEREN
jgi:glutaredoxin-like protein